jgi:Rrf2 family protein
MLRVTKLTDYATVVLTVLAAQSDAVLSASELAERAGLEPPTVSKLLKPLAQAGLVEGFRGANGGYRLAHPADTIT